MRDKATNLSLGLYDLFGATAFAAALTAMSQDEIPQPGKTLRLLLSCEL